MVRSALTFGVLLAAGLVFAAQAAQKEPGGEIERAAILSAPLLQTVKAPERLIPCTICANQACSAVRVRGLCTVEQSMEALRRHRQAAGGNPDAPRHRSRAVSGADYERLVLDEVPQPGRARAEPKYGPQEEPGGAPQPGMTGTDGELLNGHKSDSLNQKTQFFRPLELSEEADDGQTSEDEAAETTGDQDP